MPNLVDTLLKRFGVDVDEPTKEAQKNSTGRKKKKRRKKGPAGLAEKAARELRTRRKKQLEDLGI